MSCSGAVKTAVGNCGCAPPLTVLVKGCGGAFGGSASPVSGALVQVYSDVGVTLVDSGTTDAGGAWSTTSLTYASYWIKVTPASLYAVFSGWRTFAAGGTLVVPLSPDDDHVCWGDCPDPISKTQPFTDAVYGSGTATWDGAAFVGSLTVSYPGHGPCAARSGLVLTYTWSNGSFQGLSYPSYGFDGPTRFCPYPGGAEVYGYTPTGGVHCASCDPLQVCDFGAVPPTGPFVTPDTYPPYAADPDTWGWTFGPGDCSDCSSSGVPCSPCDLPTADLTLSWTNTGGNGSETLTYSATGPVWQGACVATGSNSITPSLACSGGTVSPTIKLWSGSTACSVSTPTGPNYASTCTDIGGGGGAAWSNTSDAKTANGIYATSSVFPSGGTTVLQWIGFGFSVPSGATILGLKAEIYGMSSNDFASDSTFYWRLSGADRGPDHGAGTSFDSGMNTLVYGGPTDLGGATWTPAQVNDSSFGIAFTCSSGRSSTFSVDYARITVYYSTPSATCTVASGDLSLTSSTCSPLSVVWTVDSSSALYSAGFRTFTVTL